MAVGEADGSAEKRYDAIDRPAPSSGCTSPTIDPAMPEITLHSAEPLNCVGLIELAAAWTPSCS